MNRRFVYEAEFIPDEYDGYSVSFPQLPDAFTQGEDLIESVEMAAEVLELIIAEYLDEGKRLPAPMFYGHSDKVLRIAISVEITPEIVARTRCVSATEAAHMLGLSKGRVTHLLDAGILQAIPFGNDRLVTLASINERIRNPKTAGRPRKETAVA
ncbi:MAG: type II toxin-antitoxin system HicB family antitoxin [Coriobacteriales bacterium]|jgi:predicted RNase H-like HicB family nuclease|nr:type II toxin-antitoxin system HicB family antitoxin [Coriobacteriales bacterium]